MFNSILEKVSWIPATVDNDLWIVINPADLKHILYEQNLNTVDSIVGYPVWQSNLMPVGQIKLVPEYMMFAFGGSEWVEYSTQRMKRRIEDLLKYASTLEWVGYTEEAENIRQYCDQKSRPQHIILGMTKYKDP